jgi:hypothetical protein
MNSLNQYQSIPYYRGVAQVSNFGSAIAPGLEASL